MAGCPRRTRKTTRETKGENMDKITTYSVLDLHKLAAMMKRDARKSVRAQGFEPIFEPYWQLRIGDCVALTIWWTQDGIRQCANCAI